MVCWVGMGFAFAHRSRYGLHTCRISAWVRKHYHLVLHTFLTHSLYTSISSGLRVYLPLDCPLVGDAVAALSHTSVECIRHWHPHSTSSCFADMLLYVPSYSAIRASALEDTKFCHCSVVSCSHSQVDTHCRARSEEILFPKCVYLVIGAFVASLYHISIPYTSVKLVSRAVTVGTSCARHAAYLSPNDPDHIRLVCLAGIRLQGRLTSGCAPTLPVPPSQALPSAPLQPMT